MNRNLHGLRSRHWLIPLLLAVVPIHTVDAASIAEQRQLATRYLTAASAGGPAAMMDFYRPADVVEFRDNLLKVMDAEAAEQKGGVLRELFGVAASLDEVKRLTPTNFFLALTRRVELPVVPARKVDVLGIVEDGEIRHAVARIWADEKGKGPSHVVMVTLLPYIHNEWRVAIPESFRTRVDLVVQGGAGDNQTATQAAHTVPNTPDILKLLDQSSEALRKGDCAAFFSDYMSPNFRKNIAEKALKTLITQCQNHVENRETYLTALELARRQQPTMEEEGTRAVYDMKGQGLPFDRFTLERIGDRWYVAE